jgi:hypothetical protein
MKAVIIILLIMAILSLADKMISLWEKSEYKNVNAPIFGITLLGTGILIFLGKMLVNYD